MKTNIKKFFSEKNKSGLSSGKLVGLFITTALVMGTMGFTSCKKKTQETTDPVVQTENEQSTATDNNLAESFVSDIENMGSQVSDNGILSTFKQSGSSSVTGDEGLAVTPCATVTTAGQVITVNFGTSGCVGNDGHTRTGILVYNFSASTSTTAIHYRNPGFSMTVSSQNYVVDGYTVNIVNKTVTNTTPNTISSGVNPGVNLTWSVNATISIIKPSNAGTISWACSRTKELVNTSDTACYRGQNKAIVWTLARVKLNGSATGVNAKNENYTSVASNLVRDFACTPDPLHLHRHPFVSGTITYSPANRYPRVIDYGNGNCDLNATLTINGNTYNIILP